LGWLWPLIDRRGRTFADLIAHTEVWVADTSLPDPRRRATIAAAGFTALATVVAALGFSLVFLQQRAVAQTRDQLQNTGPALVSDMLSYSAADVEKDFEHDRTLVTEGYRPELVKEQEAVRKAGPADNEYWVTNKAVLEASRNTGAMLMLLQGQRGAPPNQRFITASLRVTFEKVAGEWKIAGLTVLAPPKLPDPPKAQEPAKPAPSGKPAPKPAPAPPPTGPGR
jgi:Mce-associated membrane protein